MWFLLLTTLPESTERMRQTLKKAGDESMKRKERGEMERDKVRWMVNLQSAVILCCPSTSNTKIITEAFCPVEYVSLLHLPRSCVSMGLWDTWWNMKTRRVFCSMSATVSQAFSEAFPCGLSFSVNISLSYWFRIWANIHQTSKEWWSETRSHLLH